MKKNSAQIIKEMQQSVANTISTTSNVMNKVISLFKETGACVDVRPDGFDVTAIFVKEDLFYYVSPAKEFNPVSNFRYIAPPKYVAVREGTRMVDIPISNDEMLMKWATDVVGMIERRKTGLGWSKEMESEWRERGMPIQPTKPIIG